MYQVYLIGYTHAAGVGRIFNYRTDGLPPSFWDIEDMEKKLELRHNCGKIIITSVSRLADSDDKAEDAF